MSTSNVYQNVNQNVCQNKRQRLTPEGDFTCNRCQQWCYAYIDEQVDMYCIYCTLVDIMDELIVEEITHDIQHIQIVGKKVTFSDNVKG
jgi:hypothetical protein